MRGDLIGTRNVSTLSHALRNPRLLQFVKALLACLEPRWNPRKNELIALDSMALTVPISQRHNCKRINDKTAGGGVLWAFRIGSREQGEIPVRILKVIQGPWCDNGLMPDVTLQAQGPVYLMDRGFYALKLIARWMNERVRFIVRVKTGNLKFSVERELSAPRLIGNLRLELDAIVTLGGPKAKTHPRVRLIQAMTPDGERLVLATSEFRWSAERVLQSYRKRWHIERFHRVLKNALGLAHFYSFHPVGIEFLLHVALLLAMLIFLSQPAGRADSIERLLAAINTFRQYFEIDTPWRRNSSVRTNRRRKKSARKKANP